MAVGKLFGTDGVRGRANHLLGPELAIDLARAASGALVPAGGRVIIGIDTRVSGPMLEAALASGFASAGVEVLLAGVIPTPAISFLIKDERADLGAVISASHNPPDDNGIKFFDRTGMKLSAAQEGEIERRVGHHAKPSHAIGRIAPLDAAATRYAAFLAGAIDVEAIDLSGVTLVVDCAYGATGAIAPRVLRHLNAHVIALHAEPEGTRINQDCGSTHLDPVRTAVRQHGAHLGIAFDGDGDRVLLIAPNGDVIDGDRMIGIAALHMHGRGALDPPLVVTTIVSNAGLEQTLARRGIRTVRTPVGDRFVARAMVECGARIGGEPSGHIILSDHSPTGDGILTAVKMLEIAHASGSDLLHLSGEIPLYPQVHRSVPTDAGDAILSSPSVQSTIDTARARLNGRGRIIVRPSGTQPVLRITAEAEDEATCLAACEEIEASIVAARSRR